MKKWLFLIIAAVSLLILSACKDEVKSAVPTTIRVTTNPAGAQVQIDNKKYGKSPLKGKFIPGYYVFRAEKKGYEPAWKGVHVEEGKNTDINLTLKPLSSSVLLTTVPNVKAEVTFKGKVIGQTPIVIPNLEYGKYSADLKAPGYSPAHIEWDINSVRPQKFTVRITENTGILRIAGSVPRGSRIKINGKYYGTVPYEVRMEQGEYNVEVSASGYSTYQQKVSLASGKRVTVVPRLNELPGKLIINSRPTGAVVTMNGKRHGTTPITLDGIKPGRVRFTLTKPNFDPVHVDLGVGPGKTLNITRDLSSSLGSIEFVTVPAGVTVYLDNKLLTVTAEDPKSKGYSKVFRTRGLRPGKHTLKFTHKRAKKEKKIEINVEKNKNHRIPGVVELWIPNAQIFLKVGSKYEGRIVRQGEKSITFEQSPRSRMDYNRSELQKIVWLSEEE